MSKFKSKSEVVEWYWPDFLNFCMADSDNNNSFQDVRISKGSYSLVNRVNPTVDNFWLWYVTDGPMGVKHAGRFYTKESIEYI